MCMYINIYTCIYTYIHICICTHMHIYIYICICIWRRNSFQFCVHCTGVFHISVHICDTIAAGCAYELVYAQSVHSR